MTATDSIETTVTIDPRFRGPDESGNGGYVCGAVADLMEGPAAVTLRHPPPLARALSVRREGGRVEVRDDEILVAEGVPGPAVIEPPPPVAFDTAVRMASDPSEITDHPFPRCFVCGPDRADGLRIFPGRFGDDFVAGPWTPAADLAEDDGHVAPRFLWAALDCPSGWVTAALAAPETVSVLGRLAAVVHDRAVVGVPLIAVAAADHRDGRKLSARSALYTASGRLLAAAAATWVVIDTPG